MRRGIAAAALLSVTVAVVYGYGVTRREAIYRELVQRGDAELARGDAFAAIESFSGAIAIKADSMAAYLKRGEAYRRRGELDAALRDLRQAADLDPSATRPRELLGDVNYAMRRYARAADRYLEHIELLHGTSLRRTGDGTVPAVVERHRGDGSERLLYKLGLAHYRDGKTQRAIEALTEAVTLDDQFAEAYYLLGLCQRDAHQRKEALVALQRAVTLAPAMLPAREELADMFGRLGRVEDRVTQLEALLGLDPRPSREVALGLAYAAAGDSAAAVQTLSRAARRYPSYRYIYVALGRVWLEIAQSRDERVALDKALDALETATAEEPGSEALTLLGRALLIASDAERAESILQQATATLPADPAAFTYLAEAAERLNHTAVAREALLDFYTLDVSGYDPRRHGRLAARIGDLSMRLNDPTSAAIWYRRAIGGNAADAALLARFADALWRTAKAEEAAAILDKALALDPALPAALQLRRRMRHLPSPIAPAADPRDPADHRRGS